MATVAGILERTRLELGDQAMTFRQEWVGDGVTDRWELDYHPLSATSVVASVNAVDVSNDCEVEERTGFITFDTTPGDGEQVVVSGTYYRYFTESELTTLVNSAIEEHLVNRVNSFNQALTVSTIPYVEEGVVALRACIKALYVLATDAAFDIDIHTPDGVTIPRSERFRQLMEMVEERKKQYDHISQALNIGPYRVEVLTLRRISKMTGRLIPIYRAQEIDDYGQRERIYLPIPTNGSTPIPSPAGAYDISMVQGDTYSQDFDFNIDLTGYTVRATARTYPESPVEACEFTVTITDAGQGLVNLSLTPDQTRALPLRCFWDLEIEESGDVTTVMQGRIFCTREVTR